MTKVAPTTTLAVPEIRIEEDETSFYSTRDDHSSIQSSSKASSRVQSARSAADSTTSRLVPPEQRKTDSTVIGKFARTANFVRKWSRNKEDEAAVGREAFMKRLSVTVAPSSLETQSVLSEDRCSDITDVPAGTAEEGQEQRKVKKKRRVNCCKRFTKWLKIKKRIRNFYFSPMNIVIYRWLTIISLAVLYNAFVLIARQTFTQLQDTTWKLAVWFVFDYTADIIYLIDILIQCRTSYIEQGLVVTNSKKMLIHYFKSHAFKLDILSLLPLDFLYFIPSIGTSYPIVRLNRLLRVHRTIQFFHQAESRTNWPNALRIINLMLYISLSIHWNACFYFLISKGIGFGSDGWVYPNTSDSGYDTLGRQYLFSLYWSTLTLTTIGEVPGPEIDVEYLFVIFDFLVGVLIFATIVGMMGGIITNMNIRRTEFQTRLDNIKQYMRYRSVDKRLQGRVIQWFNYLWTNHQSLDEETILETLPNKLRAEIAFHVHFETLSRVKIFETCEVNFLVELVLKLKPQIFSPGDYICRKGDIGKEMYIIKKGKLEVVGEEGQTVATLTEGSYFGEISILNLSASGNRRTATVRSVGYSDLFYLSKVDLLEVLEEYPEAKADLEKRAKKTLKRYGGDEDNKQEEEDLMKEDSNVENLQKRLTDSEQKVEQLKGKLSRLQNEYLNFQTKTKQRLATLEEKENKRTNFI